MQLTILILLALSVSFGWNSLKRGEIFPINVVKVEADYKHLSPEELQQIIAEELPASFWTLDINALQANLKALTWVQSVRIEKIWPETLKIRVDEKKILAHWGEQGLLSDKEDIFYPNTPFAEMNDPNLPILYGPEGQNKVLVEQYDKITKMLQTKQLSGQMLLMSESGAWFLRLDNGTLLLLGSDNPLERLGRFLRVYDAVFAGEHLARRVDLRYPHGMAVSWVEESKSAVKQ